MENDGRIPGGPVTPEVTTARSNHICSAIWNGNIDYKEKRTRVHGQVLKNTLRENGGRRRQLLEAVGFGLVASIEWVYTDVDLCYALAERFWPKTFTFHMPCGEMGILLEDVMQIIGLPTTGNPLVPHRAEDPVNLVQLCLGMIPESDSEMKELRKGKLRLSWLKNHFAQLPANATEIQAEYYTRAYILQLCGCLLFPDSSNSLVDVSYLQYCRDLNVVPRYAWGVAVLAYLYKALADFTNSTTKYISGCTPLLQVWSYLHFPAIGRPMISPDRVGRLPLAVRYTGERSYGSEPARAIGVYRQEFDLMKDKDVVWTPYSPWPQPNSDPKCHRAPLICFKIIVPHPVNRCMRQMGMIQDVPSAPDEWTQSSLNNATSEEVRRASDLWREAITHYRVTGTQIQHGVTRGVTRDYQRWYGRPLLHVVKLRYEELRYNPRGYKDENFEIAYQKCLAAANYLESCNLDMLPPDQAEGQRRLIAFLRDTSAYPYAATEDEKVVPARNRRWRQSNEHIGGEDVADDDERGGNYGEEGVEAEDGAGDEACESDEDEGDEDATDEEDGDGTDDDEADVGDEDASTSGSCSF